jgi:autotransporter-associated beta strand protein
LEADGNSLGAANPMVIQDGCIFYLGDSTTFGPYTLGSLTGGGTVEIGHQGGAVYNQALSLGNDNGSGTFSGVIADGASQLSVMKTGSGTETLSGTNTYTGSTTVSNGVLVVNGSLAPGAGLYVAPAGTLAGNGTVGEWVSLDGTLAPGGTAVGSFNLGATHLNPGSRLNFKVASANDSAQRDLVNINGTLYLDALTNGTATIKLISMATASGAGLVPDFNPASNYVWTVGSATGLSGTLAQFNNVGLDTSAFANSHSGTFSLVPNLLANSLEIHYTGSATATPPVLSGRTMLPGGSFELSFSGPSNQTFKVLGTNVLNAPRASWPVLMSGTFGVGGPIPTNFIDTNITATNKQRFYIIESP